jgi:dCMP deaminase
MEESHGRKRPTWDEYYMTVALAVASRASCIKIHSGAVIVKDKRILSTGYNGFPPGMKNCFENGQCRKDALGIKWDQKNTGNCFTVHAEVNALLQVAGRDMRGGTLYTVLYPCADCAKNIAGAGISEVVYMRSYKEEGSQTAEIFKQAGITLRKLDYSADDVIGLVKFIAEDKFE